ncbi:MAG: alanine racemase [Clostridia bacterium]|nr:alanine racemase [Clostridia bacterium]
MELCCYNSYMESDVGALCHNYKVIQEFVGPNKKVVPILKANAYGFGDVEAAKALEPLGADLMAVAMVNEAVKLRKNGIKADILVLGGVPQSNLPYAVQYDIHTIIFTEENAAAINAEAEKQGKIAEVQIKIDTGMHRVGIAPGEALDKFLSYIKTLKNIKVVGTFTHFATAKKIGNDFTLQQYADFKAAVAQIKAAGIEPKYIHCQNSNATYWLQDDICTHVRPGAMLYGYYRLPDGSKPFPFEETMTIRSTITAINNVPTGESVGYARFFMAEKPSRIATVGMGYADGMVRQHALSGGPVYVNDTLTKYVGICMDQMFIDVTDVDCKVGDEVTVLGRTKSGKLLSAFDVADFSNQPYQQFVVTGTERVGKVFKY